tara:strand:- start:1088 stop:1255 length:168 start_codon:yes stop_codon:yes gene_type:complete
MESEWQKVVRLSPVAWQHINLIGIYEFNSNKEVLNLQKVIDKLVSDEKINFMATD